MNTNFISQYGKKILILIFLICLSITHVNGNDFSYDVIWKKKVNNHAFDYWPVSAGNFILIGDHDNKITAFSKEDGNREWMFEAGHLSDEPLVVGGRLIIGGQTDVFEGPGKLLCLNLRTGKLFWDNIVSESNIPDGLPVYTNDKILINNMNIKNEQEEILAYGLQNGKLLWSKKVLDSYGRIDMITNEKRAFLRIPKTKSIISINQESGVQVWEKRFSSELGTPTFKNRTLFLGTGGSGNEKMFSIDSKQGKVNWVKEKMFSGFFCIASNGYLYFPVDKTKTIFSLKQDNGKLLWKYKTENIMGHPFIYSNKMIIFGDMKGNIVFLNAKNGKQKLKINDLTSSFFGSFLLDGNKLYFTAEKPEKPMLYCVKIYGLELDGNWNMIRNNPYLTGGVEEIKNRGKEILHTAREKGIDSAMRKVKSNHFTNINYNNIYRYGLQTIKNVKNKNLEKARKSWRRVYFSGFHYPSEAQKIAKYIRTESSWFKEKIKTYIDDLGSSMYEEREQAMDILGDFVLIAYPMIKNKTIENPEKKNRMKELEKEYNDSWGKFMK